LYHITSRNGAEVAGMQRTQAWGNFATIVIIPIPPIPM